MAKTLLLGAHHAQDDRDALGLAVDLARPLEARIVLGGVIVPGGRDDEHARHNLAHELEALSASVPTDVPAETRTLDATSVADGLDALAADCDADLLVLGAHHRGGVLGALRGDIAVDVAFDEPGTLPEEDARVVRLDPATIADAASAFGGEQQVPPRAITVGLRTLRAARAILLLVTGEAKAEALRALLDDPVSTRRPASLLRDHPRLTIVADRAAAGRLAERRGAGSDRALVVLGHREPDGGSEHLASEASFARLHHAASIAHREPVRLAVLTGWTTTGGLSEAEQMLTAWNEPDTPALLEVAGRNTAENASRTLPLLLATGVIRRVTVVTSLWHVRAPYFFAAYRRYGFAVDSDPARHHGPWLRMLAHEAHELPAMPRERRAALAAMRLPREAAP